MYLFLQQMLDNINYCQFHFIFFFSFLSITLLLYAFFHIFNFRFGARALIEKWRWAHLFPTVFWSKRERWIDWSSPFACAMCPCVSRIRHNEIFVRFVHSTAQNLRATAILLIIIFFTTFFFFFFCFTKRSVSLEISNGRCRKQFPSDDATTFDDVFAAWFRSIGRSHIRHSGHCLSSLHITEWVLYTQKQTSSSSSSHNIIYEH